MSKDKSTRPCKHCKRYSKTYITINLSAFCDTECAISHARNPKVQAKAYDVRTRQLKAKHKKTDLSIAKEAAKKACHSFIRYRDRNDTCISCDTRKARWNAGHFIPDGRNSFLRYHPLNIHKQCAQCNLFKGGNLTAYEDNLRLKIGDKQVDWLKAQGTKRRWTVDELNLVAYWYKTKLKTLKEETKYHE